MYKEILPGLKGDILEIGSGLGTFSEKIITDMSPASHITLTDISSSYLEKLQKKFSSNKNVSVSRLDLNCKADYDKIGYEKFDSIVALNVLEHVQNDEFALQQLYNMLKNEGTLILLVPCHKFLYNIIDTQVGHFRRYTKKELEYKVSKTRLIIQQIFYFNMLGIVGWYLNGNLAKNANINSTASRIFDRLVPLSQHLERILRKKIGLSIICYLRKESWDAIKW
jgi:2-polyprenyl-3-methyl-5-hydroxy-6-metoxy-1,4-benzoquinol methylase